MISTKDLPFLGRQVQGEIPGLGFKISLSLSRESAIFQDAIDNSFSCFHLATRDRDYHMTILVFRDENEIRYCYSHVSRRDRDFRKSFLVVEREKMKLTLVENSRDREFSLTSALSFFYFKRIAQTTRHNHTMIKYCAS